MTIVQNTELDLRTRQIAREEESLTLGIDRYKKDRERNDEADSGPGKRLIRDAIGLVAAGIEQFVAEARNWKPPCPFSASRGQQRMPHNRESPRPRKSEPRPFATGATRRHPL